MAKKPKVPAPVNTQQSVSDSFAAILRHNFDYLSEWEQAAHSWDDIEGVHQTRVSFRRMRSALQTFRSAVPKDITRGWSEEMRWLANQLGTARDMDVFIDEGLGTVRGKLPLDGEQRLLELAEAYRAKAYENVRTMLDGERYKRFKREFAAWLDGRSWERSGSGKKADKRLKCMKSNLIPFARKVLDKQERRVLEAGSHVNREASEEMHRLRIECKKLRYATEFFASVFAGMDVFITHMKGLQDLLGVMNDVIVMRNLLDQMLAGVQDPKVLEYAGGLVGWRTREYHELLASFDDRWDEFVEAKNPWWRKAARDS